jgi:hypothetical protein
VFKGDKPPLNGISLQGKGKRIELKQVFNSHEPMCQRDLGGLYQTLPFSLNRVERLFPLLGFHTPLFDLELGISLVKG